MCRSAGGRGSICGPLERGDQAARLPDGDHARGKRSALQAPPVGSDDHAGGRVGLDDIAMLHSAGDSGYDHHSQSLLSARRTSADSQDSTTTAEMPDSLMAALTSTWFWCAKLRPPTTMSPVRTCAGKSGLMR